LSIDAKLWPGPLLCLEPLRKPRYIDNHAFVRTIADLLDFVARLHVKLDAAAVDLGHDGFGRHAMADWCCCEMVDIHAGADSAFARIEIVPHGVERGVFHCGHHHRRGEHRRQSHVFELVCQMTRCDAQRVGAFCSDWNCSHRFSVPREECD